MAQPVRQLPETGFLRLKQIIGDPKAKPAIPPIIPVSKSTWWEGVRDGRYPSPVKWGPRTTVWRVEDIRALIANGPATPAEAA
jgi:prophage regulatory protein